MAAKNEEEENEIIYDGSDLSSYEKISILLLSLREEVAADLLKMLDNQIVQQIGMQMANMSNFSQEKIRAVHNLFLTDIQKYSVIGADSENFVKRTLTYALGKDQAGNIIDQITSNSNSKGLDALKWMDSKQVAGIIKDEHPQIQSIVLSYLPSEQAADVMSLFDEDKRVELTMRIAKLEELQPSALQELSFIMEQQFMSHMGGQSAKLGGVKAIAKIINNLDTSVESEILDRVREEDEDLAQEIQDLMFTFDNLEDVDDKGIQALLREVSQDVLIKAIKGASERLKGKFFKNLSKRAADLMKDDLEASSPIRVSEVEQAQKEILAIARKLADDGQIILATGSADEFL